MTEGAISKSLVLLIFSTVLLGSEGIPQCLDPPGPRLDTLIELSTENGPTIITLEICKCVAKQGDNKIGLAAGFMGVKNFYSSISQFKNLIQSFSPYDKLCDSQLPAACCILNIAYSKVQMEFEEINLKWTNDVVNFWTDTKSIKLYSWNCENYPQEQYQGQFEDMLKKLL